MADTATTATMDNGLPPVWGERRLRSYESESYGARGVLADGRVFEAAIRRVQGDVNHRRGANPQDQYRCSAQDYESGNPESLKTGAGRAASLEEAKSLCADWLYDQQDGDLAWWTQIADAVHISAQGAGAGR